MVHYSKALQAIQEGHTSKLETLIAAFVAFTMDSTLYNYKAGQVHLRAARTLIEELEFETFESQSLDTYDLVHNIMRMLLVTGEGFQAMMTSPRPVIKAEPEGSQYSCATFQALRDQMTRYIMEYQKSKSTSANFHEFPIVWEKAVSANQVSGKEPPVVNETMDLLSLIAKASTLSDEEQTAMYGDCLYVLDYVLNRVLYALETKHELGKDHSALLDETLRIVVRLLFGCFSDESTWWDRKDLIERIAQHDHRVFEETMVLQSMNVNC